MPQDSLRSIVYRSLVRCDDPNGVVENETIRKPKTSSRTMGSYSQWKTRTYSNPSFVENETVRNKERTRVELPSSSPSFQLMKVSRGAQELNQMIDSWSKDMNSHDHGQSNDIAKDLLKGALDLQESLVMLCKLQDASKDMAKLKRKQKLQSGQGVERADSDRSTFNLQNRQLPIGGSSRNCSDELKRVIRESLSRQNLLTVPSVEEDGSFNQMKMDSISDIPSTSSSQSSVASSIAQRKKPKAPSVIAKLLGLEEFPAKSTRVIQKQADCDKNLNQRKAIFDNVRMPKLRKQCYCLDENEDTERKTLKEVIETMHFKGLLRSNSQIEGHELGSHLSESTWSSDEMPPIVIMKPQHLQHEETEASPLQESIWDEGPSYCEDNITEQEGKDETLNQIFAQEEEAMVPREEIAVKHEPAKKPLARGDNAVNNKNISRKLEAKAEPATKRLFQKNRASTSNETVKNQELKESKTMEKITHNKMKASSVAQNHKQKAENTNKKVMKAEELPNRRKTVEKAAAAAPVSRSQDQVRATITNSRKVETGLNITRNSVHVQDRAIQKPISKRSEKLVPEQAIDQTKKVPARKIKRVIEALPDRSKTNRDTLHCKVSVKEICPVDEVANVSSTTNTLLGEQLLPGEQMKKSPKIQIEDQNKEEEQTVFHKGTVQLDQHGSDIQSIDIDHKSTFCLTKINLKGLLLSSLPFQNSAEELFDLNINQPKILQTEIKEIDTVSRRLFLDCANELMQYKSRWTSPVINPFSRTYVRNLNLQIDLSLEKLVEEICDEVEILKGYSKVEDAQIEHVDSLFQMLESDLKIQGRMGNGGWDLGWVNGFSDNEADQVAGQMEKHILSELLEDLIIDLLH